MIPRATGKQQSYKKYFQSDEGEGDDSDDGSSSEEEIVMRKKKPVERTGRRGRPRKPSSSDDESLELDSSIQEEDEEEDRSWEDRCYICRKAGSLLCCDGCSHVAHVPCLGLKKEPEGDWHCEECLVKMTQRRTTRGVAQAQQKNLRGRGTRYR